mmetsp:Transcript_71465/g.163779  ORF Transcript_71465/g.163779 Transcript_71465/m.163779 type:complete len:399 (+) Transcript_71465:183-1379(+)
MNLTSTSNTIPINTACLILPYSQKTNHHATIHNLFSPSLTKCALPLLLYTHENQHWFTTCLIQDQYELIHALCKNSGPTSTRTIDNLKSALQHSYPQSNVQIHIHNDPPHRNTYQKDLHSCGAFTITNILQIAKHINQKGPESLLLAFQHLPFTNSEELKSIFPDTTSKTNTSWQYEIKVPLATPLVYGGHPPNQKQPQTHPNSPSQESSVTLQSPRPTNPTPPKKHKTATSIMAPNPNKQSKQSSSSPQKETAPKPPPERSLTSTNDNPLLENEGWHLAEQTEQEAEEGLRQFCSAQSKTLNESLDDEPVHVESTFVEEWPINETHPSPPKTPHDLSEILGGIYGDSTDLLTHPLPANKQKRKPLNKNSIFQSMPKQCWWRLQSCTRQRLGENTQPL